eukprot:6131341-Amphidinium_carterae.1
MLSKSSWLMITFTRHHLMVGRCCPSAVCWLAEPDADGCCWPAVASAAAVVASAAAGAAPSAAGAAGG